MGDRTEGLVVGRPHPITVYDLQFELQQRFNIPILDQNLTFNGMPLGQYPPDAPLDSLGIGNNSLISLWYKGQPMRNDYYQTRQQAPQAMYGDGSQLPRDSMGPNEMSPRYVEEKFTNESINLTCFFFEFNRSSDNNNMNDSMQNGSNQDVLKIEVFHGKNKFLYLYTFNQFI